MIAYDLECSTQATKPPSALFALHPARMGLPVVFEHGSWGLDDLVEEGFADGLYEVNKKVGRYGAFHSTLN